MAKKKKEELEEVTIEDIVVPEGSNDKKKDYEIAIAQIEKSFGKGSVMSLGTYRDITPVEHLSSGSYMLDIILGKGGFPFGRITELYGPEASGKTTMTLELIKRAQHYGIPSLFVDAEQSLNVEYAEKMGIDLNKLQISQPDSAEEALTIIETMAATGYIGLIVLDSIAALVPQSEKTKDMTENEKMAERAKILSRFLPRIVPNLRKTGCMLFCTNQLRSSMNMYSPEDVTPGGKAMKYYASQRLKIGVVEKLKMGEEIIGQRIKIKTTKNKMNSPYKEAMLNIIFGHGIDKLQDLVEVGTSVGVIQKSGTWFSYGEDKLGQGENRVKMFLQENPDKETEIREKVLELVGPDWGKEGRK